MIREHARIWPVLLIPCALIALLSAMPAWPVAATGPQEVALGTPVTFAGAGFSPNESLSLWQIGPDGGVTPLTGLQADAGGAFSTTVTFPIAGQWQVTAHSIASGNETVGSYTVDAAAPPGIAPGTSTSVAGTGAPTVAVGSPAGFSGTGFTANEAIALWETGPDSSVTPLAGIVADADGAFTTTVSFPSAGQWQVTAHGIASGNQTIGSYAVGATRSTTTAPSTPTAAVGSPVTFSGTGFAANEAISLWTTDPAGAVAPLGGIGADANGAFSTTVTFPGAGQWEVTAHGMTSAKESVGTYAVGSTAGILAGTAAPQAAVGSSVAFSGTGFAANEAIALWETGPDAAVTPLDGGQADANGAVSASASFPSAGYWQLTAHGKDSGHEVIAGYNVGDGVAPASLPAPAIAPGADTPIAVVVGAAVTFASPGFATNELVNAWMTAPDGSVAPLATTQASPAGRVAITASFPTAGLWQVTAHGKDSGHDAFGRYRVAAGA